jgi:TolB-like protein
MPGDPNKLSQFWQELKRRKVVRVISVYAAAAFVILELTDIVAPSLGLPAWTLNFIIILLCAGFIISVILAWIYDIHPEGGIVKTESVQEAKAEDITKSSNGWKMASYISFVVIIALLALNLFTSRERIRIDESLEKSIAVLPFMNLIGDPDQEYICVGLTDEIISHLFKVSSFDEVRSLTSVLPYKDSEKSATEIAEALHVNYILEGSYKRIGAQLRVTAQLIEPGSDKHIWLNDYDRPYEEIIAIPADIAVQIATHINAFLSESEKEQIQRIPTTNLDAYEIAQQISYIYETRRFEGTSQVVKLALEAISLDPGYVDAYAVAGIFTLFKGVYAGGSAMRDAAMEALPYFEKALELNPHNASAHSGMGVVNELARWNFNIAEKEYQKSIYLEPNNDGWYALVAEFYLKMHQLEDAVVYADVSHESINTHFIKVKSHILSGNQKEANDLLTQAASDEMAHPFIGENYIWLEEYDSAKYYLELALHSGHYEMLLPRFQAELAFVYEKTNLHQQSDTIINQLIAKSDTTSVGSPAFFTAWYYSWIGEVDSAFYWLEKAYNNRSPEMPWLKVDPAFNSLKDDPRYWDLYERTGHKAYDDYMASRNN